MKSGETKYKLLQEEKGGEELKNVSNAHYPFFLQVIRKLLLMRK